ncbi:MAG: glycoside hydrolase family 32 protein [Verrucomicrobia bacterium]|nr:glycoside hydrolase family 32 protein [Verrucomicrobiota bacterium]
MSDKYTTQVIERTAMMHIPTPTVSMPSFNPVLALLCFCALSLGLPNLLAAQDILIADFDGQDYGEWKSTGDAFGPGPAKGTLPGQMTVDGYKGSGLVNSFYGGDGSVGTLTSPEFTIQRKYISFLIGGGKDSERTCMNLLINGQVVRNATGPNDKPGGSERLEPEFWDVSEFIGKTGIIRIVDSATGGWGHINVDHIIQTDQRPPGMRRNAKTTFKSEKRYLNFPIKNGAIKRTVTVAVDDQPVVTNEIELADATPDWWAFMDISDWRGKTISVTVEKLPDDSNALAQIEQSDAIKGGENIYREPLRGQFHFSSKRGWNNDPNGLVFYNGEYHLFYQHNPYGWSWGNMHWGHAVSRDLVHWQELPDALAPDRLGPMFSGSAVVDWQNTTGFGRNGQPPLILIYTAAGNPTVQCIAFSLDGRSFAKFDANPVLNQITGGNRDPKVFWHAPSKRWIMTLYVELNRTHTIHFFSSPDLKNWTYLSRTDGFFECPDFFELPVDDNPANKKWVLTAASSEYMIGTFDGTKFVPETPKLPGHRGRGFYAAQTFSDIPPSDGRRIQIGWFQTETRGMPFNQSMTVPLELKLITTSEGPRLTWTPIKELHILRTNTHLLTSTKLTPESADPLANAKAQLVEIRADFEPDNQSILLFTVRGAQISYDARTQKLIVNGHAAPAPLLNGRQNLVIYCDRTGLEVFASGGLTYVPMPFQPAPDNLSLSLKTTNGHVNVTRIEVHNLESAWPQQ